VQCQGLCVARSLLRGSQWNRRGQGWGQLMVGKVATSQGSSSPKSLSGWGSNAAAYSNAQARVRIVDLS